LDARNGPYRPTSTTGGRTRRCLKNSPPLIRGVIPVRGPTAPRCMTPDDKGTTTNGKTGREPFLSSTALSRRTRNQALSVVRGQETTFRSRKGLEYPMTAVNASRSASSDVSRGRSWRLRAHIPALRALPPRKASRSSASPNTKAWPSAQKAAAGWGPPESVCR